ncbi:hypothetical protein ABZZ79_21810 [Streptomyces sp. NPDC006458]|uniref:hypothetical protein n=1 Tax=Streptomyces sp. NPDC006458 TaxID=3154302 RepID=UPI00339F59BF
MPEHVSILQWAGVAVLAVGAAACAVGLSRMLRRGRFEAAARAPRPVGLPALPRQRRAGPELESVELTAAERDAFAGLVRQFAEGH